MQGVTAVLVTAGTLVLGGCSSSAPPNVATYEASGGGLIEMSLQGTLEVTPACVTLAEGATVWTLAFPGEVSVEGDTLVVAGKRYASGASASFTGGRPQSGAEAILPPGCPSGQIFLVAPA